MRAHLERYNIKGKVPATHWWIFPPHVHLQMLEEVMVFIACEGHHHPHCAG